MLTNSLVPEILSFTVGSKGSVLSVEVRDDHHRRAVKNYSCWRASWLLRRGEEWPDNVQFLNADLCSASSLLAGQGFHAVGARFSRTLPVEDSVLIQGVTSVAGSSGSHQPPPGFTRGDPAPAPRGRVCRLPRQVSVFAFFKRINQVL